MTSLWRKTRGAVYFLQVAPAGPIKIGFTSKCVQTRIRAVRQSSPHEIELLGSFVGTPEDERAIQKHLAGSQLRGEWFHPTEDILSFISDRCSPCATRAQANEAQETENLKGAA